APAGREVADDRHALRGAHGDQIVEDLVGHRFVEDALVPEVEQVVLQRLQLDAPGTRCVSNAYLAEVGQSRLRAHRRELRAADVDLVIAFGPGVRKRFNLRATHKG